MDAQRSGNSLLDPNPYTQTKRLNPWVAASVVLHATLLVVLVAHRAPQLTAADAPGSVNGHHLLLTYTMSGGAPPSALQRPHPVAVKQVSLHTPTPPSPVAAAPSAAAAAASTDAGAGNDALGDGDLTLALVRLHPPPHPDLGQLPAGTRGDVVIDIVIDSMGHIAKSTMIRGLGHGVDETVLATIQQWTFQPALRKGLPVTSEQELLFHYERG